jgi:hypothetical protein
MSRDNSQQDIISEQDYNAGMASASASPEGDSPGDSEADAGSEFLMGLNYIPEEEDDDSDETGEEPGEITFSEENPKPVTKPLPETAKVVSSDQPSPWSDLDTPSDVH